MHCGSGELSVGIALPFIGDAFVFYLHFIMKKKWNWGLDEGHNGFDKKGQKTHI